MDVSLEYHGKRALTDILSHKSSKQLIFENSPSPKFNTLYTGDNFPIVSLLREDFYHSIDLIYIDPPFGTGQTFDLYNEQVAYEDILQDHHFLEFLRIRLILLRELLSEHGSLYIHIDKKVGHYIKVIMDEVFGERNFLNDITRIKCNPKNFERKAYGNSTDMILLYAKERGKHIWNEQREPLSSEEIARLFPKEDPLMGPYTTHPLHAPGITQQGDTGQEWKGLKPPQGRHWRYRRKELDELQSQGLIEWSSSGNPRKKVFAKDHKGRKLQDIWRFKDKGRTYTEYPTEKNIHLLKRIIKQSSNENSIVLDAFAGSGNTLLMAHELQRKWIGIDQSEIAIQTIKKNFQRHGVNANFAKLEESSK